MIVSLDLELTMAGEKEITLEYGSDYLDAGATAVFYGSVLMKEPETVDVIVEGTVDTATVGTYTVTCKLGYEINAPLTVKIEEA